MSESQKRNENDEFFQPKQHVISHVDGRRCTMNPATLLVSAIEHDAGLLYLRFDDESNPEFWLAVAVQLVD